MDLARIVLAVAFLSPGAALQGADCNRNGSEDAGDIAPPLSHGRCGLDSSPDALACEAEPPCA